MMSPVRVKQISQVCQFVGPLNGDNVTCRVDLFNPGRVDLTASGQVDLSNLESTGEYSPELQLWVTPNHDCQVPNTQSRKTSSGTGLISVLPTMVHCCSTVKSNSYFFSLISAQITMISVSMLCYSIFCNVGTRKILSKYWCNGSDVHEICVKNLVSSLKICESESDMLKVQSKQTITLSMFHF